MTINQTSSDTWADCVERYRKGAWRAPIFRDMILRDAGAMGKRLVFLDIGCGKGFDGDLRLQSDLAAESREYIGIEPDRGVQLGEYVTQEYRSTLEESSLPANSVDVAFAVMVLEHLPAPAPFFARINEILRPGGVFWGFTMDARHFFCFASRWMQRLKIKDAYLTWFIGQRGETRYENYPTYYRANSPRQLTAFVNGFAHCDFVSFSRVGQLDSYSPMPLRPLMHAIDRIMISARMPGSILAIRLQK